MNGLLGAASEMVTALRSEAKDSLDACGSVCVRSGVLRWSGGSLAIHTDFGPEEQDKDTNQDFALAWTSGDDADEFGVRWAVVLADGVTSSWHAEHAAELACWTGLRSLIGQQSDPRDRALDAINAAGESIGRIGDIIEDDADAYLPDGEFHSTWRFTLREGLLLQTTLSLVWMESGTIHLAFVGDGGAMIESRRGDGQKVAVLGDLDEETNRVHAVGPRNRQVSEPDVYREIEYERGLRLACFTDGIGRACHAGPKSIFQEINELGVTGENIAARLIQRWISTRPNEFEDNLSLAVMMPN